jgi:hypothetical protein
MIFFLIDRIFDGARDFPSIELVFEYWNLVFINANSLVVMPRYFMYDNHRHVCVEGDHVINIFSFSKAYGMMGWRIGYVSPVHQPLFLIQKVMI